MSETKAAASVLVVVADDQPAPLLQCDVKSIDRIRACLLSHSPPRRSPHPHPHHRARSLAVPDRSPVRDELRSTRHRTAGFRSERASILADARGWQRPAHCCRSPRVEERTAECDLRASPHAMLVRTIPALLLLSSSQARRATVMLCINI
jgi:hypothetical protein